MKITETSLEVFYSESPDILWNTQQDLERSVVSLFDAREVYKEANYNYEIAFSEMCAKLIGEGKAITTAKALAPSKLKDLYKLKIDAYEMKRKYTIIGDTIRDRINTIKKLMTDTGSIIKNG